MWSIKATFPKEERCSFASALEVAPVSSFKRPGDHTAMDPLCYGDRLQSMRKMLLLSLMSGQMDGVIEWDLEVQCRPVI